MPRNNIPMKCVPRVELDHRAREARLRLERAEQFFKPGPAVSNVWLRWFICLASAFRNAPQGSRTRGSLSDQRPPVAVYSA
jgi:hypothetical protein